MNTLSNLVQSEIADFFAGFGGPGEPDIQSGEAQRQLTERVLDLLRKEREAAVPECFPELREASPGRILSRDDIVWNNAVNACRAAMLKQSSSIQASNVEGARAEIKQPSSNSPVIPDGWKLVPIEPTAQMIWAAKYVMTSTVGWDSFKEAYVAMLAAAPGKEG